MPADVDGPHGVAMSPDGQFYYVTTAHGTPFGYLWKYATKNDSLAGRVMLGNFPATAQVTPDGAFVYVVNFNLHGEMVPSDMSVVAADEMVEVARIKTCTMPHGSRVNPQGTKQYSGCMMDDLAVEIDTRNFGVSRHFLLTKGKEMGMQGAPNVGKDAHASHDMSGHGMEPHEARRHQLLTDVGAAVGRRTQAVRRLQQVERHRRDRRRQLEDDPPHPGGRWRVQPRRDARRQVHRHDEQARQVCVDHRHRIGQGSGSRSDVASRCVGLGSLLG